MNMGEGSMKFLRRSGKMKERGPDHSWASGASSKGMLKMLNMAVALVLILGISAFIPQAEAASASWQVGRGIVQKGQPNILKLSLRNDGTTSKEAVRIIGRWAQGAPGKRGFSSGELGSMNELGSFSGEVALKKTAIIEVPLSVLGTPPAGTRVLEIAVITGRDVTDGQAIQY